MAHEALEPMAAFFARRVDGYDEHMLTKVVGCRQGYLKLAELLPEGVNTLLDLGIGTGLELDAVYRRFPDVLVTGVDLCRPMLDVCAAKYASKRPTLICGDYLEQGWEPASFDTAISFETLHHLAEGEKLALYRTVCRALRPGGCYVQGDYAATNAQMEEAFQKELLERKRNGDIVGDERVHFDAPFTAEHDCALLLAAGFVQAETVWRQENTVLIVARVPGGERTDAPQGSVSA